MTQDNQGDRPSRHLQARRLAEEALAEERAGHDDIADRLMEEAQRVSAEAVIEVLEEHEGDSPRATRRRPARDAEVAAETGTVRPGSDAPDRAGITGAGSGADHQ